MIYESPEATILQLQNIVHTSMEEFPVISSSSGGIQLPFIPG